MATPDAKVSRMLLSLDGLSLGDALGQSLSTAATNARRIINQGMLAPGPWWHTDDTQMAMAVVEELAHLGRIDPSSLAWRLAKRYQADPGRGYGKGARMQLQEIVTGASWQKTSAAAFGGRGSMGNGSAMRSAPLGAYFADDLMRVAQESALSSKVTHAHAEGIAGSIAVSLAAAQAWNTRALDLEAARQSIWNSVLAHTPTGETTAGIEKARHFPLGSEPREAARVLGSGFLVTCPDTVPFALWCALRHLHDYREALIATLEGDGDCDTNCAIVGGIVSLRVGHEGIPAPWLASRESLDLSLP